MAISPNDRQRVMRTSRVEDAPNPGPWPQATPVGEVSQPDGSNYSGYDDSGSAPALTIGAITVAGEASPTVGDTETYSASHNGTATDVVYTFSAPGETFTGGTVTWANDGPATVTATGTSGTAGNSPQTGTLAVTVAAAPAPAPALALASADWNPSGGPLPSCTGQSADPGNQCGAAAFSPELNWTLTNDPGTITEWRLSVTDDDAGGYVHWNVTTIPFATTSISQETDPFNNGWPAGTTVGATDGGGAFANGFEGFAPPPGENHTYSFVVTGHAADGSLIVTSNNYQGTFLG